MKFKPYWGGAYLKQELLTLISREYWREDIFAGITVACIAIPLSLAIAMASGVDPGVGLISGVIGGILAALFGGTRMAVTGPAAAMAVIIASNVEQYGMTGLLIIGLICGLLQVLCGIFRLGRYSKLVPLPVVAAFTAGIGFIIIVGQLPKALQLPAPDQNHVFDVILHIGQYFTSMNPMALALALLTLAILKILPRYFPKAPTPLIAVAIPALIVYFGGFTNLQLVGQIPHKFNLPLLPDFKAVTNWSDLLLSAFAVFALASLETLLSSSAVDNMGKGDLHNPNQELIGQGLANIGSAAFGGLPVTGVIARSSVNIAAGAKTRRSAIIHSLVILCAIYLFPGLIERIPVAALAGILLSAGMSMINIREFAHFWKTDRGEALVYSITFVAIIVTDLVEGVQAGIAIAFLIVALKMLKTRTHIRLWSNQSVMRVGLTGGMTFWSFDRLHQLQEYVLEHNTLKVVIIDFSDIHGLDSSGAGHLMTTAQVIGSSGIKIVFHNMSPEQRDIINGNNGGGHLWYETVREDEIKILLESWGIENSAREILKHGMQKYLVDFAKERKQLSEFMADNVNQEQTLFITCSDSRLNPNSFSSAGIGEIFILRNMGNIIPPYAPENDYSEAIALEYALNDLNIRNIVICAHTECSTIRAALKGSTPVSPQLKKWFAIIRNGFTDTHIPEDALECVKDNALNQVRNLKTYPQVQELLKAGKLKIGVWIHDPHSVDLLNYDEEAGQLISVIKA